MGIILSSHTSGPFLNPDVTGSKCWYTYIHLVHLHVHVEVKHCQTSCEVHVSTFRPTGQNEAVMQSNKFSCTHVLKPVHFGGRLNCRSADVLTRIPFFESFASSRVNTLLVAVRNVGWRICTQLFLGVKGNTLRCPRTKGTAVNEWVHSFVDFCLILYPRPVLLTFQPQICKDGFISIVFDVSPECCLFDRVWAVVWKKDD